MVPLLLEGLAVLSKERPKDPIEFLASYLEANNPERLDPKNDTGMAKAKEAVQRKKTIAKDEQAAERPTKVQTEEVKQSEN